MGGRPGGPGSGSRPAVGRLGGLVLGLAFGLVFAVTSSGCQLLAGSGLLEPPAIGGTTDGSDDGGVAGETGVPVPNPTLPGADIDVDPKPIATYRSGRATIQLGDGTVVVLDRINRGPHVYSRFGSQVRWSNLDGWYLTVSGAGSEPDMGGAYLALDRIRGIEHLTAGDPAACTFSIATATAASLRGTAQCRSLRWTDALETRIDGAHPEVAEPPFSAIVTFEAAP